MDWQAMDWNAASLGVLLGFAFGIITTLYGNRQHIAFLESELKAADERAAKLRTQRNQFERDTATLENENADLRGNLQGLTKRLGQSHQSNCDLARENLALRADNRELLTEVERRRPKQGKNGRFVSTKPQSVPTSVTSLLVVEVPRECGSFGSE